MPKYTGDAQGFIYFDSGFPSGAVCVELEGAAAMKQAEMNALGRRIAKIPEADELLGLCLNALNEIPNSQLREGNTYDLAAKLTRFLSSKHVEGADHG